MERSDRSGREGGTSATPRTTGKGRGRLEAESIVANTQVAAFAIDRTGTITLWNARAHELLGHSEEWALGRKLGYLLRPRDIYGNSYPLERVPFLENALEGQPFNPFDATLRSASGERVQVTLSVIVVIGRVAADHKIVCLVRPRHRRRRSDEVIERLLATPQWRRPSGLGSGSDEPKALLTPRQCEVLERLADGDSAARVAADLEVSPHTIRHHIQAILQRLEARTQAEAVAKAYRRGLI